MCIGLRVAWCVVVVHALTYARFAVEYSMQVKYHYLAGGLCVIAICGTLLRWGPPVLFA